MALLASKKAATNYTVIAIWRGRRTWLLVNLKIHLLSVVSNTRSAFKDHVLKCYTCLWNLVFGIIIGIRIKPNSRMSPLQKLTTEHTEYTERVRFMNKRIIFCHQVHVRKIFTTLFLMKDKIIFSFCDLRGLCGEKITFLHGSQE